MNILSPLHYIAANNPTEAYNLLVGTYGMPAPITDQEFFEAVDYAASQYGEKYINDMLAIHPDKGAIMEITRYSNMVEMDPYKASMSALSPDQLNTELAALNAQLITFTADETARVGIIEKINFLTELIKSKTNVPLPPAPPQNNEAAAGIHKTNQVLLFVLVALAFMFLGSKMFKTAQ